MHNLKVLLALVICLGAIGVRSSNDVTVHLEDYLRQNQRQYDAKIEQLEDELAKFREVYTGQLRGIDVHSDILQIKLEETDARLSPIELIDSWHKQCVQNYSIEIPLVVTVKTNMANCKTSAQSNLNSFLTNAVNTMTSMKNYYKNNFKALITDCEKKHPVSQQNYTTCVKAAVASTNTYTINTQKTFDTYMQQAKCSAEARITTAWECSFGFLHSTSSILGKVIRLIDDCIDNRVNCAINSCITGCSSHMDVSWNEAYFLNSTINNPFFGLNSKTGCMNVRFKY